MVPFRLMASMVGERIESAKEEVALGAEPRNLGTSEPLNQELAARGGGKREARRSDLPLDPLPKRRGDLTYPLIPLRGRGGLTHRRPGLWAHGCFASS